MSMEKTLKEILDEILDEVEQELEEATTTAGVDGYQTPFAFGAGRKKDKKKEKDVATQAGYTIAENFTPEQSYNGLFKFKYKGKKYVGKVLRRDGGKYVLGLNDNGLFSIPNVSQNDMEYLGNVSDQGKKGLPYLSGHPKNFKKVEKDDFHTKLVFKGGLTMGLSSYLSNSTLKDINKHYRLKLTKDDLKGKSVNEISAKKGLEQVIKGNTKQVEGIKLSKEMAQAMLDWFNSSPYGRKYPKAKNSRLHVSIGTMLAFGLDRYAKHKGAKEELKYLKSTKESVNEAKVKRPVNRWLELKNDETMHPHKKMAMGLKELKYQLREVEKFFNWYNKIKTMNELDSQNYWKRTNKHIYTIKEKLINIAKTIQEIEK